MSAPRVVSRLSSERRWWLALGVVTLVAGVLRLIALSTVPDNLFYDAAVRSMGLSLHNFLYGAFDPTARTAIDKPPIDLWLQVIAVKLFGFNSVVLKLPEAIAGTAAIPLLYDLVRRLAGPLAALCGATTLALLPTSVITARSDTMDSFMMLLLLVVAWLLLRSVQRRAPGPLLAAAAVLGLAFDVKLFEALVPVPAFLLFVWLCWRGQPFGARVRRLAAAGTGFVAVSLCWMVFVSLSPARDRPYAIGSTNGSVWNSVFVFDGWDRIVSPRRRRASRPRVPRWRPRTPPRWPAHAASVAPAHAASLAPAHAATVAPAHAATVASAHAAPSRRARSTASPPSPEPLRLFQYSLVGYGTRLGTVLFAAVIFGLRCARAAASPAPATPPEATREQLITWSATLGVALWLITGYLLAASAHTQPRYLEAFRPPWRFRWAARCRSGRARTRPVRRVRAARDVCDRDGGGCGGDC